MALQVYPGLFVAWDKKSNIQYLLIWKRNLLDAHQLHFYTEKLQFLKNIFFLQFTSPINGSLFDTEFFDTKAHEPPHDKTNKMMCTQRTLRSAWASAQSDQSILCTQKVVKGPMFIHADSEDSDQTGRIPRLICLRWAPRTCHLVGFVMQWLMLYKNRLWLFGVDRKIYHKVHCSAAQDLLSDHHWCWTAILSDRFFYLRQNSHDGFSFLHTCIHTCQRIYSIHLQLVSINIYC